MPKCNAKDQLSNAAVSSTSGQWRLDPWRKTVSLTPFRVPPPPPASKSRGARAPWLCSVASSAPPHHHQEGRDWNETMDSAWRGHFSRRFKTKFYTMYGTEIFRRPRNGSPRHGFGRECLCPLYFFAEIPKIAVLRLISAFTGPKAKRISQAPVFYARTLFSSVSILSRRKKTYRALALRGRVFFTGGERA